MVYSLEGPATGPLGSLISTTSDPLLSTLAACSLDGPVVGALEMLCSFDRPSVDSLTEIEGLPWSCWKC